MKQARQWQVDLAGEGTLAGAQEIHRVRLNPEIQEFRFSPEGWVARGEVAVQITYRNWDGQLLTVSHPIPFELDLPAGEIPATAEHPGRCQVVDMWEDHELDPQTGTLKQDLALLVEWQAENAESIAGFAGVPGAVPAREKRTVPARPAPASQTPGPVPLYRGRPNDQGRPQRSCPLPPTSPDEFFRWHLQALRYSRPFGGRVLSGPASQPAPSAVPEGGGTPSRPGASPATRSRAGSSPPDTAAGREGWSEKARRDVVVWRPWPQNDHSGR
ncbi:MAG: hypothetical protein IMW99_09335 [Firmicutes bacterium]|nr:hypothetical protein [Bacillota bacterium]